jgi:hypothetical protein
VPIKLDRADLAVALERAYQLARSDADLPAAWDERVARIEQAPKTYVAALGAALLAKATDARVDSLAHKPAASDRGYALRSVAEFLATKQADLGIHLGATGRWPLNNAPFNRNHERIDRFHSISPQARPFYEDLVRYLRELDRASQEEATEALAVFIRRRRAFAESELQRRRTRVGAAAPFADVLEAASLFVTEDPEGGRRGQAFAAAVLDCAYPAVRLRTINDPGRIDVSAWHGEAMRLAVEVKQLAVEEGVALELAADAADAGCDRALLVAFGPRQALLDRERIHHESLTNYGVLVEVTTSVREFVSSILLSADVPIVDVAYRLQHRFDARMIEIGVGSDSRERWNHLCRGVN